MRIKFVFLSFCFIPLLYCADIIFSLQVHPDVRKYMLNAKRTATTVQGLEKQLMSPPVVATTCLSTDQYGYLYLQTIRSNNKSPLVQYFRAECSIIAL